MARETIPEQVEFLFRREAARLTASLTRRLGVGRIDLAEEVVQETLLQALRLWPFRGVPDNPAAWMTRVATNLAVDRLRREGRVQPLPERALEAAVERAFEPDEIDDDSLRMIFTCCHPALDRRAQVALTLKLSCGLSAREIAAAFLVGEATMAKRLYRAREALKGEGVPFEVPQGAELRERLEAAHSVLYLLFNEGYESSHAECPVRRDLCREALRLALLLARHDATAGPASDALVALFALHSARLPARMDDDGAVRLLADQDRSRWNRELIERGLSFLERAAAGVEVTRYQLEAAIAACHCKAARFEDTDWASIERLYDLLYACHPTPVVRLNRAVAVGQLRGADAALEELRALEHEPALREYPLLPATLADFLARAGRRVEAAEQYRRAIAIATSRAQKTLLQSKLAALQSG